MGLELYPQVPWDIWQVKTVDECSRDEWLCTAHCKEFSIQEATTILPLQGANTINSAMSS